MSANSYDPFESPRELRAWWGRDLEKMAQKMNDVSPATRLNSMSKGIDVWARLYRLEKDVCAVEEMEAAIQELREKLASGPVGVVNGRE